MNQKKSTKILLIFIIILIIIILLGGVAFVYLATDIFKNEKEVFFKYITQIGDSEKGILDSKLVDYFEKRKNIPYNDEGKFSLNITSQQDQEMFENVNNFNISFSGQVDTVNSKASQDITLNYSDEVNFPINYRQIDNTIGLQTKYIGSKYIAVQTNKLANIMNGQISFPEIKTNNIGQIELNDEQIAYIKNTYIELVNKQLEKGKFSKIKEVDITGYKLSLTGEEFKNIVVQLFEKLKNDQTALDIINKYLGIEEDSSKLEYEDIEDFIETINDKEINEQNIDIIVYSKNGQTKKVKISTSKGSYCIEKIREENILKILFSFEPTEDSLIQRFTLKLIFEGLDLMENVKEIYECEFQYETENGILNKANDGKIISMPEEKKEKQDDDLAEDVTTFKYTLENNISFTDRVDIEEFRDDNSIILTNYESEQVSNFLNAVGNRINQVNKQQMEELGLEETENPIQYIIPSFGIYSNAQNVINKSNVSQEEINTFNKKFEIYQGTNLQAQTVKGLLSIILLNNDSQDKERQIQEINFKGEEYEVTEQTITFIKQDIDMEKNYRIEFEKNEETGIIYRVVINEK